MVSNVLIVTGGSRGIGKETIAIFQNDNWRAINISRSDCDLHNVVNINADLSTAGWDEKIKDALTKEIADAEKICLVHNAAAFASDAITNLSAADFRQILEFNTVAPMILNQLVIPHMKSGSSIIYIGSTLSEIGVPNRASYVITKHALTGMMRATTQDLVGKGISSCCICPGFVNTTMLTSQVEKNILDQLIKQKVTAGRLIEPKEIATFIQFCAHNPIINGSILHANLGQISN